MMLLSALLIALSPPAWAFDFSIDTTSLTQCGGVDISWTGGTPPYTLTVIPSWDYPWNITIPDNAVTDGEGSYRWQVNYPPDIQLVIMMGDATGIGAGGVSDLYTVGSGTSECTLRSNQAGFDFQLDPNAETLVQCDPVKVSWDPSAVAPVRIIGVIPHGQVFEITSADMATQERVWNTNMAAGTQFILAAFNNGPYGNGGSSRLLTVGSSSNSGCVNELSPSSTPAAPSATSSRSGSRTTATTEGGGGIKTVTAIATVTPTDANKISGGTLAGVIAGASLGGAAVVAAILALWWFCCHRKKSRGRSGTDLKETKGAGITRGDIDLASQYSGREGVNMPDPNDSIYLATAARRDSRGSHLRLPRTRVASDDGFNIDDHDASTISPFWDGNRVSQSQWTLDVDLGPPLSAHPSAGWSFPSTPDSPSGHSPSSPLVPQGNSTRPPSAYPSSAAASHRPRSSIGNMSKAQLASSFVATNPDRPHRDLSDSGLHGATPPMAAPLGGFVREQDAGRVGAEGDEGAAEEAEHLPPMYDPEWQNQSRAGRSG